jgi:hypothetical protein
MTVRGVPRRALAKIPAGAPGSLVQEWSPLLPRPKVTLEQKVHALAIDGGSLYVGGEFNSMGGQRRLRLAKLSATGKGLADAQWNPGADATVFALAADGSAVYAGGAFSQIGGQRRERIAKLAKGGKGAADVTWDFSPFNDFRNVVGLFDTARLVETILPTVGGVYAGGNFTNIAQVPRNGFALLAALSAPVITQDPTDPMRALFAPAPLDRTLVSHLRIGSVSGGALFKSDMVTPVIAGEFITVEEGAAGLVFVPNGSGTPSVTATAATAPSDNAAGSAASELALQMGVAPPVLQFDQTSYTIREGMGPLVVNVQKTGAGAANVAFATSEGSARAGALPSGDYETASGTLGIATADL